MKRKSGMKALGLGIIAYAIALLVSLELLKRGITDDNLRIGVALLPVIPMIAIAWTILNHLRRMDELQRIIQLQSIAAALAGTAIITFGYGFLENIGYPRLSMFVVWPIMAVFWFIAQFFASRRYK